MVTIRRYRTKLLNGAALVAAVLVAAMSAVRCSNGRRGSSEGTTTKTSALSTDYSTAWWQIAVNDGSAPAGPSLAASASGMRGTEIFCAYSSSGSKIDAYATHSNIELKRFATTTLNPVDTTALTAASSDGGATVDLFWRYSTDGSVGHTAWNGTSFPLSSAPPYGQVLPGIGAGGATAGGTANRLDLFAVGTDHRLWHTARNSGTWWGRWTDELNPLPTADQKLASLPPAVIWRGDGVALHVFVVGSDGAVWTRMYDVNGWTDWLSLGGSMESGIAATSFGSRIDLFAAGSNTILRKYSTDGGTTWTPSHGWEPIQPLIDVQHVTVDGVLRRVAPTAVARADGRIDLFVRDSAGNVRLMTIRPAVTFSPSATDRTVASSCQDQSGGWENTAATCQAGGTEYVLLSYGCEQRILRADVTAFDGSSGTSCNLPSGSSSYLAPSYEIRFPLPGWSHATADGGTTAPAPTIQIKAPVTCDSQIVRLANGHLIAIRGSHICSTATVCTPSGIVCTGGKTATGAWHIYMSSDCGGSWSYQGTADPCQIFGQTYGIAGCHTSGDDCDTGPGFDRVEAHARGNDLFMTMTNLGDPPSWNHQPVLLKSTDEGASWTEWVGNAGGRILPGPSPIEVTTVGSHVVQFTIAGASGFTPTVWIQSKDGMTAQNPVVTETPYSDWPTNGWSASPSIGIVQSASSSDGDYVRIAYSVQVGSRMGVKTGLIRVNADQSATTLASSFVTITAASSQGSILFPTLVEADRVSGPASGDERPPVVLYWVETSTTPASPAGCIYAEQGSPCDWGSIAVNAAVFRGASRSAVVPISAASWTTWTRDGDYVHGASYYRSSSDTDRFFLHWRYQGSPVNGGDNTMSGTRILDVLR